VRPVPLLLPGCHFRRPETILAAGSLGLRSRSEGRREDIRAARRTPAPPGTEAMNDEDPQLSSTFTVAVAVVASVLFFLALGLLGLSGGENHPRGSTQLTGPFVFAFAGTITAWLAHVWLQQGHENHAILAEGLTFIIFIGAAIWLF
jgi:hypothetical protein